MRQLFCQWNWQGRPALFRRRLVPELGLSLSPPGFVEQPAAVLALEQKCFPAAVLGVATTLQSAPWLAAMSSAGLR